MLNRICVAITVFVVVAVGATAKPGDKESSLQAKKAFKKIDEFLKGKSKFPTRPQRIVVKDKTVNQIFPNHTFVAVRYRQYPVAISPPKGLKSSNVFAVSTKGKLNLLTTNNALIKFFARNLENRAEKIDVKTAAQAARAWLTLMHELVQDGFFKFEIVKAEATREGKKITVAGRSVVMRGGNGELKVEMSFSPDGGLSLSEGFKIRPGPRPRCQATKLLDADPIVRYMAESELLFMGEAARPYLLEQRLKAEPGLRRAIDRVLQQIEAQK